MSITRYDLDRFCGSEVVYKHWLNRFNYTEGVRFLAKEAGAYWLIDALASYQLDSRICHDERLQEIQFWDLTVNEDQSALLVCRKGLRKQGKDPLEDIVITQKIEFTDFPLKQITLYLSGGILLLPSEY